LSIDFCEQRWQQIKENYQLWWTGELDRPLVQVVFTGCEAGRKEPDLPSYGFTSFYDLGVPAEKIVDRWDYDLSCQGYAGDAFPNVFPNFGPGVLAAFLGAELENREDTVWFHPARDMNIADIHFQYSERDVWLDRIKDIYRAATKYWQGLVQLSMTDLGGSLDVLATFRPGEKLLLDLYDSPEEVKRLSWETHDCWFKYFEEFAQIIERTNPGYSDWAGIYSAESYYMLQCDFSYMIGPEMFDEFVKPELAQTCKRLAKSFYHLDGPGALVHLDSLLGIEELDGIQWVPGAGQGPLNRWLDVLRRIRKAGKLLQIINIDTSIMTFDLLDEVVNELGSGKGLIAMIQAPISEKEVVMKHLAKYNIT